MQQPHQLCFSGYLLLFNLVFIFTNSYQITDMKPIAMLINNWEILSVLNSKKVANAGTKSNSAVIVMVMAIMSKTKLFLYLIVVKKE